MPSEGLTPLAGWASEVELQGKLNEPRIVRGLSEAEGAIGIQARPASAL
jgi:hypothetical protein